MSKKIRTVEVVLTVELPDSETNETVATFFNWEICHMVSEETEGDLVVKKIDVRSLSQEVEG